MLAFSAQRSHPPRARPRRPSRAGWEIAGGVLATAAAWVAFATRAPTLVGFAGPLPRMPVLVGMTPTDLSVPLGYQLSVFPVFGATVAALALDVAGREAQRAWLPRAALVVTLGVLAAARLAGVVPISGHAVFLFGVIGYEIAPPSDRDAPLLCALAAPAVLVVAWCKLAMWGDPAWFAASAALGAAVGVGLARAARA